MTDRLGPHEPTVPSGTVRSLLPVGASGPALVTVDGEVLDHETLRREVDRLALQLASFGILPNDRVVIVLPNGPEMSLALLAVMSIGCAAPLNPKYRQEEFRFYLGSLRPKAVLAFDGASPLDPAAVPKDVIAIGIKGSGLAIELVANSVERPPTPGVDVRSAHEDHALVLHTSGTTSQPKIVPLRQRHLASSAGDIAESLQLSASDCSLNVMPLFHIHGIMAGMLAPLSVGGSVVCTPGFDAFKFARLLDELRVPPTTRPFRRCTRW